MKKDNLSLGKFGELTAQQEYEKAGYKIIAQNEFNRFGKQFGEIDFIAVDRSSIVFVEVKTRTFDRKEHGGGLEAVHQWKQRRLVRATKLFLLQNQQYQKLIPRIDVCVIEIGVDPVKSKSSKGTTADAQAHRTSNGVDRALKSVIILSNAVEDLN